MDASLPAPIAASAPSPAPAFSTFLEMGKAVLCSQDALTFLDLVHTQIREKFIAAGFTTAAACS